MHMENLKETAFKVVIACAVIRIKKISDVRCFQNEFSSSDWDWIKCYQIDIYVPNHPSIESI